MNKMNPVLPMSMPVRSVDSADGLRDRGTTAPAPGHRGLDEALESENTRLQDELRSKIHDLKHVTIKIGTEIRVQNGALQDMDSEWGAVLGGALTKAMNHVKGRLSSGSQHNVTLYLILFSLFIFVIMWLLLF